METYTQMKKRHQKEVWAFPHFFALSNQSFEKGMKELGLAPSESDKVFGSNGGYNRCSDAAALQEMFERHHREMQEAIAADSTGEGFIYQMFRCELANHEYGFTEELDDTLDALGITDEDIDSSQQLRHGLQKAIQAVQTISF